MNTKRPVANGRKEYAAMATLGWEWTLDSGCFVAAHLVAQRLQSDLERAFKAARYPAGVYA